MCRLFALHSSSGSTVRESLVNAGNALRVQSRSHPDGWGIAWYDTPGQVPAVERGGAPAFADERFDAISRGVLAVTVVAHVRKATVGPVDPSNCHPFRHGRWSFAHNGTVEAWDRVRARVERRIRPDLRQELRGDTDSERVFFLLLGALEDEGVDVLGGGQGWSEHAVLRACARVATWLVRLSASEGAPRETALNFVLTDGSRLVAHRLGRDLHVATRKAACAGAPRCTVQDKVCLDQGGPQGPATHVVVASEPTTAEHRWQEVPERGVVLTDPSLRVVTGRWEPGLAV